MARARSVLLVVALGLAVWQLRQPAFVPPAVRPAVALPAAALLGATPAFADEIGDAAAKLANQAYPFLNDIDWYSTLAIKKPGSAPAADVVKAIAKTIDMGVAMDSKLLNAGVEAHHKAIVPILKSGKLVLPKSDFEAICASIGRMVASVPESKVMDVYNSFSKVVDPKVPGYLMKTVKEADAKAAYAAFMDFKDVVKAHPITAAADGPAPSSDKIDGAAKVLSAAAYPFLKDVDWNSDLFLKNPGPSGPVPILKAIDKALVMGMAMNPAALKAAAAAHTAAIYDVNDKGVTSLADFEAINAALGKAIASVPTSTTMDVFNSFAGITFAQAPAYLMGMVKEGDAKAAYTALMEFKDVVRAAA
mmetsp:Transcript_2943/g.6203  ORF Transcript_2943/g.6203 Transcript_2943/m.6203 type:complete len:362 (-) Transcript_2943:162-1247(-)